MQQGEPSRRDLARLYAICEDADAELGSLAAELDAGQLRSLVTDTLGKLSALQWYAVKRLGGIPGLPGGDDAEAGDGDRRHHDGDRHHHGDGIDWAALYAMADLSA